MRRHRTLANLLNRLSEIYKDNAEGMAPSAHLSRPYLLASPLSQSQPFPKLLGCLVLAIMVLPGIWGCSGQTTDSQQHPQTAIDVTIDPKQQILTGEMRLELKDRQPLTLTLGRGFEITTTAAEHAEVNKLSSRGITIKPEQPTAAKITWRGSPRANSQDSRAHIRPRSVLLDPSSGWYPRPAPQPFGYTLKVTLPDELQVVAEGERESDHSSAGKRQVAFHHNQPASGITLVAGPWQKHSRETKHGRVYTFFPDHLQHLNERYLKYTGEYFDTYSELIGTATHNTYSVVAAPVPVGLAFAGFTYIGEKVLQLPFIPTNSLPHEVVHNWWGRGVYTDHSEGNWNESLTQYMGDYYQATQRSAAEAIRMRGDWLRSQAALPQSMDYPLVNFRQKQSRIDDIVGYQRGAFLFHTLELQLGQETFVEAIKTFYRDYQNKWAGWHNLRHTFATVAEQHGHEPDKINDLFFWFLTTKHVPELSLTNAQVRSTADGYEVAIKLHWPEGAYPSVVPIVISGADSRHEEQIKLRPGEHKAVTIPLKNRPELLEIDPDQHVYRQLARGESTAILRQIQLAEQVSIIGVSGADWTTELLPIARRVFAGEIDKRTIEDSQNQALLIVGTPADVQQALHKAQACSYHRSPPISAKTVAWSSISGSGQPILALSADSLDAAQQALQRLQHFGRHSYVGFNGHPQTGLYEPAEQHGLRQRLEVDEESAGQ